MNRVEIAAEGLDLPDWSGALESFALKVLGALGKDGWDLSLALCDDATMRELNRNFRNRDESTDVLSFALGEHLADGEEGERYLAGDIVVSLETLPVNAAYFNVSQDEELRRLVVHGILHLDGMDHASNDPSEPMLSIQEKTMSDLSEERILR